MVYCREDAARPHHVAARRETGILVNKNGGIMNQSKGAKLIARTALGIALVVVAQLLGKMIPSIAVIFGPFSVSQLITGSLVNCILLVFTHNVGLVSGLLIGVLSSILATLLGVGPIVPAVTPVIALGNAVLVIVFWVLCKIKLPKLLAIIAAAAAKCAFLWLFVPKVLRMLPEVPEKQAAMLGIMFSWPQGITALCGGLLALAVMRPLSKALKK